MLYVISSDSPQGWQRRLQEGEFNNFLKDLIDQLAVSQGGLGRIRCEQSHGQFPSNFKLIAALEASAD